VIPKLKGVLRHCTDMTVEHQYTDSQGRSEVAIAFCRLLGFELLPRLKAIHSQRLYRRPDNASSYPALTPVLSRTIDWELCRIPLVGIWHFVATTARLSVASTR
jgi:TnpA family transposase